MVDCVGKALSIGDRVICSDMNYADLLIGEIVGFTPKKARVRYARSEYGEAYGFKGKKEQLKESYQIFKYDEVVRCKDCKYCRVASWGERFCARKQTDGVYAELSNLREDDFCSYGERKEKAKDLQDCTYNKNGHCIGQKLMPECDAKNCDRRK